jgi:hypothetical protein
MDILKELLGSLYLLGQLILNYFTYGAPFAVLHALVAVMLVRQTWYRKIRVETQALERWEPRARSGPAGPDGTFEAEAFAPRVSGTAETTRILDEFVADCDKLGGQGFFIPMTDFSDRLDSIVDGITAEMHDRTNLFILVGVAGTLLGIFEFAFQSQVVINTTGGDPAKTLPGLSDALTRSMSQAFPVGFVGLLLTFFSQVIASFPERRLRTALADATGKALAAREGASRSHANALQDSVKTMQETMGSSVKLMSEAMQPLANLQNTLGEFVKPTMDELREHLGKSLELVRAQFDEIQKTNAGTQKIVESAMLAVGSLNAVVENMIGQAEQTRAANEEAVRGIRTVNEETVRGMRQQQATLAVFHDTLTANLERVELLNDTVAKAAEGVESLPARVQVAASEALDGVARETVTAWRGMSDELKDLVVVQHENLLDGLTEQAQKVHDSLHAASSELEGVASRVKSSVEGLAGLPERLDAEMKTVFGNITGNSNAYWNERTDDFTAKMSSQQVNFLGVIREKSEDVEQSLGKASDSLTDVAKRMDVILGDSLKAAIKEVKEEMGTGLRQVNRVLMEKYPEVSAHVLELSDGLGKAVEKSREIQTESAAWLVGVKGAYERLEEFSRLLTAALDRAREENAPTNSEQARALLQQNVEEVKRLSDLFSSVGNRIPAPGQVQGVSNEVHDVSKELRSVSNEVQTGLAGMTRLLTGIRNDLAVRAQVPPEPPDGGGGGGRTWRPWTWFRGRRGKRGSNGGNEPGGFTDYAA